MSAPKMPKGGVRVVAGYTDYDMMGWVAVENPARGGMGDDSGPALLLDADEYEALAAERDRLRVAGAMYMEAQSYMDHVTAHPLPDYEKDAEMISDAMERLQATRRAFLAALNPAAADAQEAEP